MKHKKAGKRSVLGLFYPKEHRRSIHSINLSRLKKMGISNLIVDLDETLRKRNSDNIPRESIYWIKEVKKIGFKVCIISNNILPWKADFIRKKFHVPVTLFSLKPFPFALKRAMKTLRSNNKNTAVIGDQLYTDILGANLVGIYSILVDPLTGKEKGILRKLVRWMERKILPKLAKRT